MPSSSQAPPIRTFNFDTSAVGNVRNCVNLFRGDVNLTQSLFTMPGRTEEQSLDVDVSLLYQSNVLGAATTWNQEAPTSTVGLGWSLPVNYIEMSYNGALTPGAVSYTYQTGGSGAPLVQEPETPFLFSFTNSQAGSLSAGVVPTFLVSAFGVNGFPLSASATLEAGVSNEMWTVVDDDLMQLFNLVVSGNQISVSAGGTSFQLQSYDFQRILYYSRYERWTITDETGVISSFGGMLNRTPGASVGNSIEWGVCWASSDGAPLWTGASANTANQQQFARAWHLAQTANSWGDAVTYEYNTVGLTDNLLSGVEQQVGAGGKSYTKACYLSRITDVYGRLAVFSYGDKLYSNATPESPREYADPHKSTADNTPNAYQDRYETLYLAEITVYDTDGLELFGVDLEYNPSPNSAVANVSGATGSLEGDTCKRYLTGIVFKNGVGNAKPALLFTYYLDSTVSGYSPGALQSANYAQGAVASWGYTKQSLAVCERTQTVQPPTQLTGSGSVTPRVWFGQDYAVTCWYNSLSGQLSLQVYTWDGRWILWQPSEGDPVLYTGGSGINPDSLQVVPDNDFFALYFETGNNAEAQLYIYSKNIAMPGQWTPATIDGKTTGQNAPVLSYSTSGASFIGGSSFLIVGQMNLGAQTYSYDRITWRWTTREWTKETISATAYQTLTAFAEYYLMVDTVGNSTIYYLDGALNWQVGGETKLDSFYQAQTSDLVLVPSGSFVAASCLQSSGAQMINYDVYVLQWDASYQFTPDSPTQHYYSDAQEQSGAYNTTWVPTVASESMIGIAGHVLRFNGQIWMDNCTLHLNSVQSGIQQRYAYGDDVVIQVLARPTTPYSPTANVLGFDPNANSDSWTQSGTPVTTPALSTPSTFAGTANWPSVAGSDFISIGQYLYSRGTSTNWGTVVANETSPTDLQAAANTALNGNFVLDTQSVINQSPKFLTYLAQSTEVGETQVAVVVLKNGQMLDAPLPLFNDALPNPNELLWQASQPGGPGTNPSGPSAFISYPYLANGAAPNFTSATEFYLHRYAGDSVDGNVVHYAVTSFEVADGFGGLAQSAINPDAAMAACDSSGQVIKYYQTTVAPGSASVDEPQFGTVVATYLNGVSGPVATSGGDYYSMLDGLLNTVEEFDSQGQSVGQLSLDWVVYTERTPDPGQPDQTVNLNGGFVCRTGVTRNRDGVETEIGFNYLSREFGQMTYAAPWSSQPLTVFSTRYGSSGQTETTARETTYAWELDQTFRALNMVTTKAQQIQTWTPHGASPVPCKASATTWQGQATALGAQVMTPATEGSFSWTGPESASFPFSDYQPGQTPDGWVVASRIRAYTSLGLVVEQLDGNGICTATLFQGNRSFPVAQVVNASLGATTGQPEFAFFGAEAYETASVGGWALNAVTPLSDDAYTGLASAEMSSGGQATSTVYAAQGGQTYVLGYALKTPAGFAPATGTGWQIAVSSASQEPITTTVPLADTGGQWIYRTTGIAIPDGVGPFTVKVSAANANADAVLFDNLFVGPLESTLMAQTFDEAYMTQTSTAGANGSQTTTVFDSFMSQVATMAAGGQILQLQQSFLSRQGSVNGDFDATSPNTNLSLQSAGGGVVDTFRDGTAWQSRWQASPAANWKTSGGCLLNQGVEGETLAWIAGNPNNAKTAALYFEILPQSTLSGTVSITFGSDSGSYQVGWNSVAKWSASGPGGWNPAPLANPSVMAQQWLLVFSEKHLFFFGDGQLLFSVEWTNGLPNALGISTGGNELAFRNLTVADAPRLGLIYCDGSGSQRQVHQVCGDDAILSQTIRDTLGRALASTKCAPASASSDVSLPLLAYQPSFVDVSAFVSATESSWLMTGDLADYYQGQTEDGVQRSNDQGYPFTGTRYGASPSKRKVESGAPGLPYAIHDITTTTETQRLTTQYLYGSNEQGTPAFSPGGDDVPVVPAGSYRSKTTINSLKDSSVQFKISPRSNVAAMTMNADSEQTSQALGRQSWTADTAAAEQTQQVQMPNFFTDGPQTDAGNYIVSSTLNPLGLQTSYTDSDSGTTSFIFDPVGNLRFAQPELDAGQVGFIYYKYDGVGRMWQEGIVNESWDVASSAVAANSDWPETDSGVNFTPVRTYSYDGDGSDPTLIGLVSQVVTVTAPPGNIEGAQGCTTTESYTYDERGRVLSVDLEISAPGQPGLPNGTIGYQYNNANEVVRVDYPTGAPLPSVFYEYDDAGRIISIGTSVGASDIAAYTYDANGNVESETLNGGAIVNRNQYYSPGWLAERWATLKGQTTPCWSLDYQYDSEGQPTQRTETLAFPDNSQNIEINYGFNALKQLTSATVAGGGAGSETINSYDANGNIWSATAGGVTASLACASGKNAVGELIVGDKPAVTPAYNASGQLTGLGPLDVAYNVCLARASGLTLSSGDQAKIQLAYGGGNQRVWKGVNSTSGASNRCYYQGSGSQTLALNTDGEWQSYIYGPTGLVAIVADQTYFPFKDNQQTIHAIVDSQNNLVARYEFYAFGQPVTATGAQADLTPYRFMGQEWDAETGLYNFRARLYDPLLRRFHTTDTGRQFASPYLFVGNDPITQTDYTGDMSSETFGICAAMIGVTLVGIAFSVFTAGASDEVAATVDAGLGMADVTSSSIVDLSSLSEDEAAQLLASFGGNSQDGSTISSLSSFEDLSEGGYDADDEMSLLSSSDDETLSISSEGTEVSTGVSSSSSSTTSAGSEAMSEGVLSKLSPSARSVTKNLKHTGCRVISSVLVKSGISGFTYTIKSGQHFSKSGFLKALGRGAFTGVLFGVSGSLINSPFMKGVMKGLGWNPGTQKVYAAIYSGFANAWASDVTLMVSNSANQKPPFQGVAKKTAISFLLGAAVSGVANRKLGN